MVSASGTRSPSRLDLLSGIPKRMMSLLLRNVEHGHAAAQAARAAGRPCLEWLPDELWLEVFDHLQSRTGELHRLALVSRAMYYRVLPMLYRTVVVPWAAPEQMHAMLALLSRDEFLAACVRVLVFDDDATKFGRRVFGADEVRREFYREESLASARKRLDDKELDRARTLLYRVLPSLTNLREVVLARTHPLLFSAGAWIKQAPPKEPSRIALIFNPMRKRTALRASMSEEVFHRSTGTDIWSAMFQRKKIKNAPRITRLVSPMVVPRTPQHKSGMAGLTSLTLHHVRLVADDKSCIKRWNKALRAAKGLRRLALVDISSGPTLLTACVFPHLEQFQATGLPSRSEERNSLLSKFLLAHTDTLEAIALQINAARDNSPFFRGVWLQQPELFVKLRTLRVDAVPRSHASGWYPEGCPELSPEHAHAWTDLFAFVRARSSIIDLTLSGAPLADSQTLKAELKTQRRMKRMFVGSRLIQSFELHVGPNCVYGIPWKRSVYRYRFALQHWAFNVLLFDGLDLADSGYRPSPRRES